MSPINAWLYLDKLELHHYWPENADVTWDYFYSKFTKNEMKLEDCTFLSDLQINAYRLALQAETYLPSVLSIDVPQPITPGLFELNEPDETAPVIVTSNSRLTFDVLATIWSQGTIPAYFLLLDCDGNTVDMAIVFEKFTPTALLDAIEKSEIKDRVSHKKLIIPGLASSMVDAFQKDVGWEAEAGPICAVELPLFLSNNS